MKEQIMRGLRERVHSEDASRAAGDAEDLRPWAAPAACNGTALRKATRRVSQLYDAVLAPSGLRSTQRSILSHIARAGTPAMGDLAAALVLDRSALAHNLKPLERDGMVEVTIDPRDKRSRLVKLTATGQIKLQASTKLWEQAQQRFERAFGPEAAATLRDMLGLIASAEFVRGFDDSTAQARPSDTTDEQPTAAR